MSASASETETDARLTLDYLLRRMRSKQDFPALSASISRVQALSESDSDSLHTLCDEILQDVALTQKLLRVVNTAHYRRAGTDPIRTVSRAVSLIGVAGVRNLALSLVLLDHMCAHVMPVVIPALAHHLLEQLRELRARGLHLVPVFPHLVVARPRIFLLQRVRQREQVVEPRGLRRHAADQRLVLERQRAAGVRHLPRR